MSVQWPSDHMSRRGLAEFAIATIGLLLGVWVLRRKGVEYLAPLSSRAPLLLLGFASLFACGFSLFAIVRRREYPWIVAFAAVALPLFEPARAPYGVVDRIVFALRDLALVGAAVLFLIRAVRRADELERRTHVEALSWSYTIIVVTLVSLALVEDVLPPIRGTWIASGMLATWFIAWVAASMRYQR